MSEERLPWEDGSDTGSSGSGEFIPPSVPPLHSEMSEQGIISCVVQDARTCFPIASSRIESPEAFYDVRHKIVWKTMVDLSLNGGIDIITLCQKLKDRNQIEEAGGLAYISDISRAAPSTSNLSHYLDDVCVKFGMRKALVIFKDVIAWTQRGEGDLEATASFLEYCARTLLRKKTDLPEIEDSFDLAESIVPLPCEIVEGMLHQGNRCMIGGGSKASKTWILIDLALSISYGVPWLGHNTTKSQVLYLNFEIPRGFMRRRIMKVAEAKGITLQPGGLEVWNLRDRDASYDKVLPEVISRIKNRGYSLVIFDPIYKAYGNLDENKAGDMGRLMNAFGRLNQETGAALAFAAHFSKGNQSQKEAMDRISGSGVFGRDPDSVVTFTAHEVEDCFTVDGKLRSLSPMSPFVVKWEWPLMTRQLSLDPAKLKQKPGPSMKPNIEKVLELLKDGPLKTSVWQKRSGIPPLRISKATFYRLLEDIINFDLAIRSAIDDSWSIVSKKTPETTTD